MDTISDGVTSFVVLWVMMFCLALLFIGVIVLWRIFRKAGIPGWISLIPFYNSVKLYNVCGMSGFWVVLNILASVVAEMSVVNMSDGMLIFLWVVCAANLLITIREGYRLGKMFGKGFLFRIFSAIFMPVAALIIAFDNSKWRDPDSDYPEETI